MKVYIYLKNIAKRILPKKIIKFLSWLRRGGYGCIFWLFPIKNNKIVICNYYGKGFGDNGKYIANELIKEKEKYEIVWLLDKKLKNISKFPEMIRTVNYGSMRALYELATAKVWIDNCRKFFYPPKRKGQYYIQTWHGGIALKKIEKDAEQNLDPQYVKMAVQDSKMIDLFISNSKFCSHMYKNSFWYDGEILECGSPRCDILINGNDSIKKKIKEHYNINYNANLLLYAPTFRSNLNTDVYNIDFYRVIEALKNKYKGEWKILVRLHPNVSDKNAFIEYNSSIINATYYDDMYELLLASDILITDYSSTMFEFSLSYKPVFLYAPDVDNYINDRGFYFDINSLPYELAKNNDQLLEIIEKFDEKRYKEKLKIFLSKLEIKETGNASASVAKIINKIVYGQS